VQRLFSTFADGWPGFGLLMQRLVTGAVLLHNGLAILKGTPANGLEVCGAVLGLFILAGLWTPVAGALVAAVELWLVFSGGGDIWLPLMLVVFGSTLAMIGPGAWSVDARLFGRKYLGS
jgi:putative oxidoreductase